MPVQEQYYTTVQHYTTKKYDTAVRGSVCACQSKSNTALHDTTLVSGERETRRVASACKSTK